jgi:two-component system cell cycle sensor histidine kinase/response regulator CckA
MNNRILIVDDNPAIHADFNKILRPQSASVSALDDSASQLFNITRRARQKPEVVLQSACSGEEALRMVQESTLRQEPYAMAFMDVHMPPGWDGVDTAQRLWEIDPDLLIVFCTAYSNYSWAVLATKLGYSDKFLILKKPFEAIEVTQLAVAMIQRWTLARESQQRLIELDRLVAERTRHLQLQIEKTKATEERFAKAFHFTPLPMFILKADTLELVDANENFAQLAGDATMGGHDRQDAIRNLLRTNPAFIKCLSAPGPLHCEQCNLETPVAGRRTLLVSRESFFLGLEPHMLVVSEDITERLASQERLRQSQKMEAVGQLAAGIAHDFNNIMTVILGRISDHIGDPELPNTYRESLTEVLNSGIRAAELTRQLLAFGRRQALSLQPINLEATLRGQIGMLGRVISENYRISLRIAENLPPVLADPAAVHHIIMNLMLNARDAMPEGGCVELEAHTEQIMPATRVKADGLEVMGGHYICLSVRDEGCGMDEHVRARIFEPFFTTKEVGKGSGLGLPMVYGLVAQLSGWLEVDSQPNCGSIFRIFLPVAEIAAPAVQPAPKQMAKIPCGQGRVALIVEDDAPIRRMLCEMVKRFGFEILSAASAHEALMIWEKDKVAERVNLLITDIVMPGSLNGFGLGARLQAQRPNLKVVYSTGYSAEMLNAGEILRENGNYLPKPYELSTLATLLAGIFPRPMVPPGQRGNARPEELALTSEML